MFFLYTFLDIGERVFVQGVIEASRVRDVVHRGFDATTGIFVGDPAQAWTPSRRQ